MKHLVSILLAIVATVATTFGQDAPPPPELRAADDRPQVFVIPMRDQIADPILFILRRGLKEAMSNEASMVVIHMDTPGGSAGTMLQIMEALDRFEGTTVTFIDREAISAGALIAAVTDEIYFVPRGVIGAAEIVMGTGQDVPEGMKRKINSYIAGKIRSYNESNPRRAQVIKAMMEPEFELKLDDKVIKAKGELLTLTAEEAMTTYGDPPTPLFGNGIYGSIQELLDARFGAGGYRLVELEVTWSERLAQYLTNISPLLMGLGLLLLFIEFKTPGFGVFGVAGLAMVGLVFASSYLAGLSGHEPALIFGLGLLLVAVEIFFFPGLVVPALVGIGLMLGSLVWALADLWPGTPQSPRELRLDDFLGPLRDVGLGVVIAIALALALARFLPRSWVWDRLVLQGAIVGTSAGPAVDDREVREPGHPASLVGKTAVAVTDLYPSGEVEIEGHRYQARSDVGYVERGSKVRVTARSSFGLVVVKEDST
jgi:membrane-bound serine protease (ClpP class)